MVIVTVTATVTVIGELFPKVWGQGKRASTGPQKPLCIHGPVLLPVWFLERVLNLDPVLCARPESVLCQMLTAKPSVSLVCQHWIQPMREGRDHAPCRLGEISELEPTTNPGALRGALSHMLLGKAASPLFPPHLRADISTACCPPLSHRGSSSHCSCRASETPVCDRSPVGRVSTICI